MPLICLVRRTEKDKFLLKICLTISQYCAACGLKTIRMSFLLLSLKSICGIILYKLELLVISCEDWSICDSLVSEITHTMERAARNVHTSIVLTACVVNKSIVLFNWNKLLACVQKFFNCTFTFFLSPVAVSWRALIISLFMEKGLHFWTPPS